MNTDHRSLWTWFKSLRRSVQALTVIAMVTVIGGWIVLAANMLFGHAHDGTELSKEHFGLAAMTSSLSAAIRAGRSKAQIVHIHAEGPAAMCGLCHLYFMDDPYLVIHYLGRRYIIEMKIWRGERYNADGEMYR